MKFLPRVLVTFCTLVSLAAAAEADPRGAQILGEFEQLFKTVRRLNAEFEVGGFLKGKSYGDYKLLWRIADHEDGNDYIRIYRELPDLNAFEVSYHRSQVIVPGRTVIRRFVGPAKGGWRADTVDANTGEYLGSQGTKHPRLQLRDAEILDQWCVRLLE